MQSLKRKAQYTRSSKLESATEAPPYKKRIEHAGYQRYILHRNPPRFDPDGDIVELGDDYEDESELSTVEENPYADIQLENLLAPLTSAAELPTHPAMSVAYTSKHLTRMTSEAGEMARREQIHLWRAKSLFTKLQGDVSWVPSGLADMSGVEHLQDAWADGAPKPVTNGDSQEAPQIEIHSESQTQDTSNRAQDVEMADAEQTNGAVQEILPEAITNGNMEENGDNVPATNGISLDPVPNGAQENGDKPSPSGEDASDTASQPTSHRMTTRARAQAPSDPSPPSSPSSTINPIHPLFTFPTSSLPDRDYGLPAAEAEDTRMLLMAFVQKQEEISRLAIDLHSGMLQGERMRQDVFKWAKAEAHVGEMSDGEDWYDQEEWGLDAELVKGRDEEEEEGGVVTGKKSTRQRRKPDKDDR
ncbi:RXT2-like protein [Lophiotrema nucula]|uniref:RXT2-like protein n=1 Tax=Lophiotrema nucula TaxID=690887 RepID=A0A6A5ZP25_9PLEO|nr:RXT2-like protein [Lophiotrema nucula]